MSVNVWRLVWRIKMRPNEKYVLLALCDYANHKGGSVFPSIKTLAGKVCLSERQTQRIVHKLILDKWVSVVGNVNGGSKGQTRHYQIGVGTLKAGVIMSPVSGDKPYKEPVTLATCTGDAHVTQNTIEPSNIIYIEMFKKVGVDEDTFKKWFGSAQFIEDGKAIVFKTEFIRNFVEQKYSSRLFRVFGFYPKLKTASPVVS